MNLNFNLDRLKSIDLDDLRSIDFNDIGSAPKPVRAILLVIIFLLVLAGGYYYTISGQLATQQQMQHQEQNLKKQFIFKAKRAANLRAYTSQLKTMRKSFGKLLQQLPNKTEIPGLLVDISQAAISNGLQIELFQPQSEKRKGFYAIKPIHIQATGTYLDIAHFVNQVASLSRIVTLNDIQIHPTGRHSSELKFSAIAKTYRYLPRQQRR